jgi:hypothetical protein
MAIKKYYQVVCDGCSDTIQDFHSYPSYAELRHEGVIISKGKHYCSKSCKDKNTQLNDGGAIPPITKVMGILAIFL